MILQSIVDACLRNRFTVLLMWSAVCVLGVFSAARLPVDAFPDTTPIQVQVNTVEPSLSPLEIERQVTAPLERGLAGLPGLEQVRSVSKFGFSQVTLQFADGTDIWLARQVVAERVSAVELPAGLRRPTLGPVATGLGEIFHYLVTGEKSLAELRTTHDWLIRPQLQAVPGVAEINAWGGDERRFDVVVDIGALQARGLSLSDLTSAIEAGQGAVGGGSLDLGGEATLVQGTALLTRAEDVAAIVVKAEEGVPVRVGDVARVVQGRELRRGAVTADGGGEAVLGLGFMLLGENTADVARGLRLRLDEVRHGLPAGVRAEVVYDRTTLVETVLRTVRTNLLEAALLVAAVLFLFLGDLRAGLVVALAIPVSVLFAANFMLTFGVMGSLMSLGALDFGLLVDGAVIQVESALRRTERDRREAIRLASLEVLRPTVFGVVVLLVVYLPILTLEGIEGKLFRPMALTVVFALIGSLLASITLIPVVTSFLPAPRDHGDTWIVRRAKALYAPVLRGALRRPGLVLAVAVLALLNAAFLATRLGSEFVPRLGEGTIVINTVRLASVSLDESVRYGTRIEKALLDAFPDEVARVWTRTGTAEVATDPMGLELSDVFLSLHPRPAWTKAETQTELVTAMQSVLSPLPGMRMVFTQPIEMRMNEMVAGIRSDVGIQVLGEDLAVLAAKAKEIEAVITRIPGAVDLLTEQSTGVPVLSVEVDRAAVARHGIAARDVLDVVGAIHGLEVGVVQEGERRFPLVVRLGQKALPDVASLGALPVTTASGDRVPLGRLATITLEESPSTVNRAWGRRRVVVQCNVRGRDLGGFVAEARRAIHDAVDLPAGVWIRFGGQFEHLERAQRRLLIVVPTALALIFALLYLTYGRVLDALRVFTGVPFAAVGGVAALWVRELPFSVSAAVGFVALSGVSVLADMVLVGTIRRHLAEGVPLDVAVERAGLERLRPVLMTALVAALGFVPMALHTGIGAEVQRPLATVVIGGLLSSTALTLVVLPVLYTALRRR